MVLHRTGACPATVRNATKQVPRGFAPGRTSIPDGRPYTCSYAQLPVPVGTHAQEAFILADLRLSPDQADGVPELTFRV